MNTRIAVFVGAGLTATSLALAGPAAAASGHGSSGHSATGQGPAGVHVGIEPTALSADDGSSVTWSHEWTNFVSQPASSAVLTHNAIPVQFNFQP